MNTFWVVLFEVWKYENCFFKYMFNFTFDMTRHYLDFI